MEVDIYNQKGEVIKKEKFSDKLIIKPDNKLISQVIIAYQSNKRQPIAQTKIRGEVRGGGRKPWRQKGTGRARAGTIRSPLWKGGSVIFGPRNDRNFKKKINKKIKKKVLLMSLSDKITRNHLIILADFHSKAGFPQEEKIKTKEVAKILKKVIPKNKSKILLVLPSIDNFICRAVNNITQVEVASVNSLNIYQIAKNDYLLTDEQGFKKIKNLF